MAWVDPTEQVNGNVLDDQLWNQDVVANTLAIFRHLTPVGTVIPYAGDWGDPNAGYPGLADPEIGAPFHLPCTGGVYESDDFPLLSRALTDQYGVEGHAFIDGIYGSPTHGMIESGRDINQHAGGHADPFWDEGGGSLTGDPSSWRPDTSVWLYQDGDTAANPTTKSRGWHRITLKGFAVPDMRGRSPIGAASDLDETVTRRWNLGERYGDRRTGDHVHQNYVAWPGVAGSHSLPLWDHNQTNEIYGLPTSTGGIVPREYAGVGENYHPSTGVNFLIFTGQVVQSHAPMSTGLRDGSAYRIQPVTTEHLIHQRLADPNLSDEERERLTAQLNGEPWPPMPEEVS